MEEKSGCEDCGEQIYRCLWGSAGGEQLLSHAGLTEQIRTESRKTITERRGDQRTKEVMIA